MCTREDTLAHYLGAPYLNDVISQNELTSSATFLRSLFKVPKLSEFGEHLPKNLNKSSLILKNNPLFNLEIAFSGSPCGPQRNG